MKTIISENSPIVTADGSHTMMHPILGEAYHSRLGARREATELYIKGSNFIQALINTSQLSVLDVGLGLGYNAFATLQQWLGTEQPCDLKLTSLESNSDLIDALSSGQGPWQREWPETWLHICKKLVKESDHVWRAEIEHPERGVAATWRIYCVDAEQITLDHPAFNWSPPFHFIWQDPFSPKSNPNMWRSGWFQTLKSVSHESAVLMTYSVARVVKDGLTDGGWHYQLIPGAGEKRQWMRATLENPSTNETKVV